MILPFSTHRFFPSTPPNNHAFDEIQEGESVKAMTVALRNISFPFALPLIFLRSP